MLYYVVDAVILTLMGKSRLICGLCRQNARFHSGRSNSGILRILQWAQKNYSPDDEWLQNLGLSGLEKRVNLKQFGNLVETFKIVNRSYSINREFLDLDNDGLKGREKSY